MQQFEQNGRIFTWNPENPRITCLMSVYNGEEFLKKSIDSILGQTFTDFEFLIINDGSTDNSVSIIESYDDPRIRLVHNEVNIGLTKSLNKGIDLAKGEYIARMDADDISMPERFEKQVAFLLKNKLDFSTCNFSSFKNNRIQNTDFYNPRTLNFVVMLTNPFGHSTFFFKRDEKRYNEEYNYTQDYEFSSRYYLNFQSLVGHLEDKLVIIRFGKRGRKKQLSQEGLNAQIVKRNLQNQLGLNLKNTEIVKLLSRTSTERVGRSSILISYFYLFYIMFIYSFKHGQVDSYCIHDVIIYLNMRFKWKR